MCKIPTKCFTKAWWANLSSDNDQPCTPNHESSSDGDSHGHGWTNGRKPHFYPCYAMGLPLTINKSPDILVACPFDATNWWDVVRYADMSAFSVWKRFVLQPISYYVLYSTSVYTIVPYGSPHSLCWFDWLWTAPASVLVDDNRTLRSIQVSFFRAHKKGLLRASARLLSREANQARGATETVDVDVTDVKSGARTVHASLIYV